MIDFIEVKISTLISCCMIISEKANSPPLSVVLHKFSKSAPKFLKSGEKKEEGNQF